MSDKQVAHMVFFTLDDGSQEAVDNLIDACNNYLTGHDGTVYYSVGVRGSEFSREVNNQTYHVGLHVVFENKAAHDQYQSHERHLTFIAENKGNWASVDIFDTYV
ncbi:MAG: stress responsive protein [Planctomycetaceae bacterium]|nr:stress responsive protein [Planctomycetaceae bacterium]